MPRTEDPVSFLPLYTPSVTACPILRAADDSLRQWESEEGPGHSPHYWWHQVSKQPHRTLVSRLQHGLLFTHFNTWWELHKRFTNRYFYNRIIVTRSSEAMAALFLEGALSLNKIQRNMKKEGHDIKICDMPFFGNMFLTWWKTCYNIEDFD